MTTVYSEIGSMTDHKPSYFVLLKSFASRLVTSTDRETLRPGLTRDYRVLYRSQHNEQLSSNEFLFGGDISKRSELRDDQGKEDFKQIQRFPKMHRLWHRSTINERAKLVRIVAHLLTWCGSIYHYVDDSATLGTASLRPSFIFFFWYHRLNIFVPISTDCLNVQFRQCYRHKASMPKDKSW